MRNLKIKKELELWFIELQLSFVCDVKKIDSNRKIWSPFPRYKGPAVQFVYDLCIFRTYLACRMVENCTSCTQCAVTFGNTGSFHRLCTILPPTPCFAGYVIESILITSITNTYIHLFHVAKLDGFTAFSVSTKMLSANRFKYFIFMAKLNSFWRFD